jgi:hypothetical protein
MATAKLQDHSGSLNTQAPPSPVQDPSLTSSSSSSSYSNKTSSSLTTASTSASSCLAPGVATDMALSRDTAPTTSASALTSSSSNSSNTTTAPSIHSSSASATAIQANEARITAIISQLDAALNLGSSSASSSPTTTTTLSSSHKDSASTPPSSSYSSDSASPVPSVSIEMSKMQTRLSSRNTEAERAYDSGLGSSIASSSGRRKSNTTTSGTSTRSAIAALINLLTHSTIPVHSMSSKANAGLGTSSSGSASSNGSAVTARPINTTRFKNNKHPHGAIRSAGRPANVRLSKSTLRAMRKYILDPLVQNSYIKEYHPIVFDAPKRLTNGSILCLRDLEKFLLFMASVSHYIVVLSDLKAYSCFSQTTVKSAIVYREFCELSIRAVQTAVDYIPEAEHTRPNDLPYTAGYFTDLVAQVREYARQISLQRQRRLANETEAEEGEQAEEEGSDAMDFSYVDLDETTNQAARQQQAALPDFESLFSNSLYSGDRIRLYGGMSQTGQPVSLVRERKDGSIVPIGDEKGAPSLAKEHIFNETGVPATGFAQPKYTGMEFDEDDEIHRSQARRARQKAAEKEVGIQNCADCGREFRRPCDLTKHQKTHSRPFKCPSVGCRYHEEGWPTEKEMQRHFNDKHSSLPTMYRCLYEGCDYESKRESNCKQHMEKAHGWEYVRSKKTNRRSGQLSRSPGGATADSPSVNMSTPRTSESSNFSSHPSPQLTRETPYNQSLHNFEQEFDFNSFAPAWNPHIAIDFESLTGIPGAPIEGIDLNIPSSGMDMDMLNDMSHDMSPYISSPEEIFGSFDHQVASGQFSFGGMNLTQQQQQQLLTPQHSVDHNLYDDEELYAEPTRRGRNTAIATASSSSSNTSMPHSLAPAPTSAASGTNVAYYSPASQGGSMFSPGSDFTLLQGGRFDETTTAQMFPDLMAAASAGSAAQGNGSNHGHGVLDHNSVNPTLAPALDPSLTLDSQSTQDWMSYMGH